MKLRRKSKKQLQSSGDGRQNGRAGKKSLTARLRLLKTVLLHALGILLVLLGLTLIFRDYIAKITFPALASWYLGVDVIFDDIDTTIDGKVTVYNLRVANPPGYSVENMIEAAELHMDLKLASLFSEQKVLKKVTGENIRIIPEINREGKFNFAELNRSLQEHFDASESSGRGSLRIDFLKCSGRITVLAAPVDIPLHTDFAFEKKDLVIEGNKQAFVEKFSLQNHIAASILPPLLSWLLNLKTGFSAVELSLDGKLVLHDLKIANFPGFEYPFLLQAKRFAVEIVPEEFFTENIKVEKIEISGAESAAEFNDKGQFNMRLLADDLERRFPGAKNRAATGRTREIMNFSGEGRIMIKTPKISGMHVNVKITPRKVTFVDDGISWAEEFAIYIRKIEEKLRVFTPGDILKLAAQQITGTLSSLLDLPALLQRKK